MFSDFFLFICIGFAAQLVDGAIGMAYGLIGTSTLLSIGIPPATASASIHAAEVFTTAASGLSHWRLKNIDFALVRRLVPTGMLGGFIGAYILAVYSNDLLGLMVALYLLVMGGVVLRRGLLRIAASTTPLKRVPVLGFIGGILDAIGGGGWGPIVTSSLLGQGTSPRYAIGSVNLAEFFVTLTISTTFFLTVGLSLWPIITGLIIGGIIAAPLAALAAKHIPAKMLMLVVGCVVVLLSVRTLVIALQ